MVIMSKCCIEADAIRPLQNGRISSNSQRRQILKKSIPYLFLTIPVTSFKDIIPGDRIRVLVDRRKFAFDKFAREIPDFMRGYIKNCTHVLIFEI